MAFTVWKVVDLTGFLVVNTLGQLGFEGVPNSGDWYKKNYTEKPRQLDS